MAAPRRQQQEPPADDGPVYVDEHHQRIAEFADAYVPEDRRDDFVEEFMTGQGYTKVSSWGPRAEPDPEPDPEPEPRQQRGGGGQRSRYFK